MSQKNPESRHQQQSRYALSLATFNGEKYLPACLNSIVSQTTPPFEFVVYDNNSSDGSVNYIKKQAPLIRLISSQKNIGFGCAHNEIIKKTVSEYILVTNQDLVLSSDYCEILTRFLDEHDDVGSVTGKILRVASLDAIPNTLGIDACGISISKCLHASLTHTGKRSDECSEVHEVFGVPATCALYRRSALDDCAIDIEGVREYFDDDFFMYKEDIDLAYRLRLRSWKSYCIPAAIAYHIRTAKSELLVLNRGSKMVTFWSYRNHWYLMIKNIPRSVFARYILYIALYELAKFFYSLAFESYSLTALGDVQKNYSRMLQKRKAVQSRMTCSSTDIIKWMKTILL